MATPPSPTRSTGSLLATWQVTASLSPTGSERPSRPQAGGCGRPPATPSSTPAPTGLCGAEWTRAACSFELGDLPVAWQVSDRHHPDSVLAEWNAHFTAGVPHEALTDLLLALDARTVPAFSFDGPETVIAAVCAQG
nr:MULTISPECIES: DUF317 domain-containing protein [unclassified Streptomyces]